MNKVFLGAAAAIALVAPGVASADTSGYVGFGYNTLDDSGDSNKNDYIELGGALVTDLNNGWNLQFDSTSANMNHDSHSDDMSATTVHMFKRSDSHAFGGFAGLTGGEIDALVVGAEGAIYLDRFTLSGSGAYLFDREDSDTTGTRFGVAGDWFVHDNLSVGVDIGAFDWDFGSFEQDGTTYGVNAEYQFAGSAVSVFGGWHQSDYDESFGGSADVDTFSLGLRYNLGTRSLIERDRSGASMRGGGSELVRDQVMTW